MAQEIRREGDKKWREDPTYTFVLNHSQSFCHPSAQAVKDPGGASAGDQARLQCWLSSTEQGPSDGLRRGQRRTGAVFPCLLLGNVTWQGWRLGQMSQSKHEGLIPSAWTHGKHDWKLCCPLAVRSSFPYATISLLSKL